ncbi:hypothetical protein ACFP7A_01530 [Sporolactobacillus kofuensis]|uniref:Uncharacterized protein n=1 Tax=Sporolactobacillus kofuensis TaxID=269672 RepID=A0ABW1W9Q9_9BACL|nr:hypothetical protein [Sporolactobacillus kofuensis]MCO7175983.1 hypothetical protein [Sporolactobacillus kofuensis]
MASSFFDKDPAEEFFSKPKEHTYCKKDVYTNCHKNRCTTCFNGCDETYIEFVESAAHIEHALATAISDTSFQVKMRRENPEKLIELIRVATKKELILQLLMEEVRRGC